MGNMTTCLPVPKSYRFDDATITLPVQTKFTVLTPHLEDSQTLAAALSRYIGVAVNAVAGAFQPDAETYLITYEPIPGQDATGPRSFEVDLTSTSAQSYQLQAGAIQASVAAASGAGWLYATATLAQLIKANPDGSWELTVGQVQDEPRYAWRGFSMDIARNFYGLKELTTLLDLLASYRMNVLHLHLSDDQGWRIELDSRPELAKVSGATSMSGGRSGYLTKDDYAQLQELAAQRGIVIIPEIDIPGHVNAIQHALGELTLDGQPLPSYHGPKVGFSKLYPQLPATWEFLKDVFTELAQMTHGEWIHVGGDEALESSAEEYNKIMGFVIDTVQQAGKRHVGWQEMAKADLPPGSLVQYWNMNEDTTYISEAVQRGAQLIISPANRIYLDMKESREQQIGVDWAGITPLQQSYDWDPAGAIGGINPGDVLGVEAALWTEFVGFWEVAGLLLLPRLLAAAEVAWSPQETRDFARFSAALPAQHSWWASLNLPHTPR